jgi:Fe-coproporphyrin III synthase
LFRNGYAHWPLTLFLSINGRCNLKCRMCDIGQNKCDSMFYKNLAGAAEQPLDFPFERFKSLMDEVQHFRPYIAVTTTEPFLYPHIFDAVEYARSCNLLMNITTNGLLVEKNIDEILDSGLHRLSVSLDGPPHIHNEMRGVPRTYERVVNGLRLLAEKKKSRGVEYPEVLINSFICDTNHEYLLEFVENLPHDIIDHVNIKLMVFSTTEIVERHNSMFGERYPTTEACMPDDFAYNKFDLNLLCRQADEVQKRFGDLVTLHFEPDLHMFERYFFRPPEFMDDTRCVLPWFVTQILTSGQVIVLTRCYNLNLGNILETPFKEVWNGPIMRKFRIDLQKYGRFPGCARCDGVLYR